jgi:hypothetical protein
MPAASFFGGQISETCMRAIIPIAGAALALAACGSNDQAGNTANIGQGLTAENIVSNDVTAIDAVTGDAANMAADMDVAFTNEGSELGNAATPGRPTSRPAARPERSTEAPVKNEGAANATENATE